MTLLMLDTNTIYDMMRNPHGLAMRRSAKKLGEVPKAESCTSLGCELRTAFRFGATAKPQTVSCL